MNLQKAILYNADTKQPVVSCQFNPNELTIAKSNQWKSDAKAGKHTPDMTFGSEGLLTLQMSLTFDTYETKEDVSLETAKVVSLMQLPEGKAGTGKKARPPHVEFGWGKFRSFRGVLTQVSQKFTLFLPDGTPARATLQVSMQQVPAEAARKAKGQNPTSRAAGARRAYVVQPRDTLDLIAAEELGDPTAWRILAEANGLDDPRRLRPGRTLLIPAED